MSRAGGWFYGVNVRWFELRARIAEARRAFKLLAHHFPSGCYADQPCKPNCPIEIQTRRIARLKREFAKAVKA